MCSLGFPGDTVVKDPPANAEDAGDMGSIPRLVQSPGDGSGEPLQYYCLKNSMDRGAWQAMAQHEGALPPPCIVRKDPRVPHTARRGA